MKIRPVGTESCSMRTDRRTEKTKQTVRFLNVTDASNNWSQEGEIRHGRTVSFRNKRDVFSIGQKLQHDSVAKL